MADLPKIAIRRLHAISAAAGIHPDPNVMSAFVENSLPRDARAPVVQHLAQCAECREVVFLSSPDQAAVLAAGAFAPSKWLTWPVLRWGAAAAAVVVVVAAVSLHHPSGGSSTLSSQIQMTDIPTAKEKSAAPVQEEKREASAVAKISSAPAEVKNDAMADAAGKRLDEVKKQAASPTLAQNPPPVENELREGRRDESAKAQAVEVTPAAVPVQSGAAASSQVVPGRAKDAVTQPVAGTNQGLAPEAAAARSRQVMLPAMIAPRWTLTADGTLQRSLDFGRTWQTVQVASQAGFRALAANGKDIWVGGSKGSLYHSTDAGQNWAQVQPVAGGQALTGDIIGVEFPDALHGKLTTSGNQIWTTQDGGQSWQKLLNPQRN